MQTELTRRLGLRHPVVLPQMTRVSVPALVAAVSDAGGLGILATAHLGADETRAAIREVRARTPAPFGVGVPLLVPGGSLNAEVALDERVPLLNFSLGKGDWIVPRAHAYGGLVFATVTNERHARAAERAGCDGVIAVGNEAAGHGGDVGTLVLVRLIAARTRIPVIASGGFGDGHGLLAALALGAAGVAMGTRFAAVRESPLHDRTRQELVARSAADTLRTDRFDGMDCRVLRAPGSERLAHERPGLLAALRASRTLARERGVPYHRLVVQVLRRGPTGTLQLARMAGAQEAMRRAIEDGDLERGVQPAGQVLGLFEDVPTAAELLERIAAEAEAALAGLAGGATQSLRG